MHKIQRVNFNIFPNKLFAFAKFDEFLVDDTYLYLRTYGHEGKYVFDSSISPFENMIQATIRFINSVLTPERMQLFAQNVNPSAVILPVHGFHYLGCKNQVYTFETDNTSSNLMTILTTIKLHHTLGMDYSFSCRQLEKVSRNASSLIHRIANPTPFDADIVKGKEYITFDDHIHSGSTVANLLGVIAAKQGQCNTIMCLATNPIVKKLKLRQSTLDKIRTNPLYSSLESKWVDLFGFDFSGLTEVEAKLLLNNYVKKNIDVVDEIKKYDPARYVPTYDKSLWPVLSAMETYNSLSELGMPGYGIKLINTVQKT